MYMKLKDGKSKVLTLSYDDGVVQDIRLINIMNKYGLKGTFNINSSYYCSEDTVRDKFEGRMKLSEAKDLYLSSDHEIAIHGLTHPFLERLKKDEIAYEVLEDRICVERDYGRIARGMAYPFGTYSQEVIDVLKICGICYSRTTRSTGNFSLPHNWHELHPTCHHNDPKLMEYAKIFAEGKIHYALENRMFYLWGHSYEFDNNDNWNVIEEFAEYIGGRSDIWYATNIEIYDYIKAYEALQTSVDKKIVHNPTSVDVWFLHERKTYCVRAGETIRL